MSNDSPLAIDENNLDRHWVEQPELYYQYAHQLAGARLDLQQAHQELDLTKAELDAAIRESPDTYGLPKITEASVAAAILMQPEFKQAQTAVNKKKHKVDVIAAMVEALNHKRKALEKLVDLHLTNYFAQPRERTGNRDAKNEVVERAIRARGQKAVAEEYGAGGDDD